MNLFPDILIINEDKTEVDVLTSIFNKQNYLLRITDVEDRALKLIEINPPNLIFLNPQNTKIDSFNFCKTIKENPLYKNIVVVFSSNNKNETLYQKNKICKGDYIFSKPYTSTELILTCEYLIEKAQKIKELELLNKRLCDELDEKEQNESLLKNHKTGLEIKITERNAELQKKDKQIEEENKYLKNVEKQLFLSEEKYKKFFDVSPSSIAVTKLNGEVIELNMAFETVFGYTYEELLNKSILVIFKDQSDRLKIEDEFRKGNSIKNFEVILKRKNGEEFYALVNLEKIILNDEFLIVGNILDISERRKSERIIKESELKFKAVFENSKEAIIVVSYGEFIMTNKAFLDLFKYENDNELLGNSMLKLFVEAEHSKIEETIKKGEKEVPAAYNFETVGLKKDGTAFSVEVIVSPYSFNNVFYSVILFKDIEAKNIEQKYLRQSEENYRRLVDFSPEAITVHKDGVVIYANTAFLELIEADNLDEVINTVAINYVHPDYRPEVIKRIKNTQEGYEQKEFNYERMISLKGKIIDVEVVGIPVVYGGLKAVQTVIRDISERKRIEQQLNEKYEESERINNIIINRELRMIELKKEINNLRGQLNLDEKYKTNFED